MLLISETDIKSLIGMSDVIRVVTDAYRDYSDGLIAIPPRVTMEVREATNSCIFLIANYLSKPYYGIKQASSFPDNEKRGKETVLSDIHLYCAETGKPLAIISANHLTALKTGAASAVATEYLARREAAVLSIIGTGVQARTQLAGIQLVRPLKEVRVYDVNQRKATEFVMYVEEIRNNDYAIEIVDDSESCVNGADIVTTCTTSHVPVFSGSSIKEGTHINAVGSFTPQMQEIDSTTVVTANKIVVDSVDTAWEVAGDLIVPLHENRIEKSKIHGELGDIVSGKISGRDDKDEITIYESIGFSALDIAVAVAIFNAALRNDCGINVNW